MTTDSDETADRVHLLRNHGRRVRYEYEQFDYNFRLSELHAAIGRVHLGRLAGLTRARAHNAEGLLKTAEERGALIRELQRAADERATLIKELQRALDERSAPTT